MNLVIVTYQRTNSPERNQAIEAGFYALVAKLSRKEATVGNPQYFLTSTHDLLLAVSAIRSLEPEISLRVFALKAPTEQLVEGVTEENAADLDSYLLKDHSPTR